MAPLRQNQVILISAAATVVTASLVYYLLSGRKKEEKKGGGSEEGSTSRSIGTTPTKAGTRLDIDKTPLVKNGDTADANKELHSKIEELDKKGKALFKDKQVRRCIDARIENSTLNTRRILHAQTSGCCSLWKLRNASRKPWT